MISVGNCAAELCGWCVGFHFIFSIIWIGATFIPLALSFVWHSTHVNRFQTFQVQSDSHSIRTHTHTEIVFNTHFHHWVKETAILICDSSFNLVLFFLYFYFFAAFSITGNPPVNNAEVGFVHARVHSFRRLIQLRDFHRNRAVELVKENRAYEYL